MNDLVSVIIPVHNRANLVERTLDSVHSQSYRPIQLIIVDNDSSDNSLNVITRWAAANFADDFMIDVLSQPVPGAPAARNRGFESARGRFTIFFDSDDVMHSDMIESAIAAIGNADLVYWRAQVVGLDSWIYRKPFYRGNILKRHFYNSILSTQTYMARTDIFHNVGVWDNRATVWNDWELGVRIALSKPTTAAISKVLTTIYAQKDSITGQSFSAKAGQWENTLDLVEKKVYESTLSDSIKREISLLTAYRRAILAATYYKEGTPALARKLLKKALLTPHVGKIRRSWLRILFIYTALGGRAAYYFWRF